MTADAPSAGLASGIIAAEEARAATPPPPEEVDRAELPGVGRAAIPFREAMGVGGWSMFTVLFLLAVVEEFDRVAMAVLAPDIQASLGVSDTVIGAIAAGGGALIVLGAVPIGRLADQLRRTAIAGASTALWAVAVLFTAFVPNPGSLFLARAATGLGQANVIPIHPSLLSDAYPIESRGSVYAGHATAAPVGRILGPLAVAGILLFATGPDAWRTVFAVLAVPGALLAVAAFLLKEPARGRNEQLEVLGEVLDDDQPPIALSVAFARLRAIRTFNYLVVGVGALGFALFTVPLFSNLFLEDHFDVDAGGRAVVQAIAVLPTLVVVPLVGHLNQRRLSESPARSLVLCATLVASFGVFAVLAMYMPSLWAFTACLAVAQTLSAAGFAAVYPVVATVVPYQLRSQGFAMLGVYIFLFGAFFGAILAGWISDAWGEQLAVALVALPSSLVGGWLIGRGALHVEADVAHVVRDLEEERREIARIKGGGERPLLQVRHVDFSYGSVQVLFDVDLEVRRGEALALLGTNGAGKSTLLNVISGLAIPTRGTVRLDGRTIGYSTAEARVAMGIVHVSGGRAVFDPLTVRENLEIGAFPIRGQGDAFVRSRIDAALEHFPVLADRLDSCAGDLSGGLQQQLALAKALVLEPEILLVDELSLGLAPVVVGELIGVLERLKASGLTLVIVEQSVNVALELADRAVFMEKGQVRFEGAARDLLARDDLLRAVFLGREGG